MALPSCSLLRLNRSIGAVDVDGAPHMVHVVQNEGPTVEEDRAARLSDQTLRELVGGDGLGPLQHQLPLQRVVLGTGAGRQAHGLQLATLRG